MARPDLCWNAHAAALTSGWRQNNDAPKVVTCTRRPLYWARCCWQSCLNSLFHTFSKNLEPILRGFGPYWHDTSMTWISLILFQKPVSDDMSFVTLGLILLEVAVRRCPIPATCRRRPGTHGLIGSVSIWVWSLPSTSWIFSLLWTILCKSYTWSGAENPSRSVVSELLRLAGLAPTTTQRSKALQFPSFPSDAQLEVVRVTELWPWNWQILVDKQFWRKSSIVPNKASGECRHDGFILPFRVGCCDWGWWQHQSLLSSSGTEFMWDLFIQKRCISTAETSG